MKRSTLLLLSLVPVATGYLVNFTLLIPGLGQLLFLLLPCATLIFWFLLGRRSAIAGWKFPKSLLDSHAIGLVSLVIYLWQFMLTSGQDRNLFLAAFSQSFTVSTNLFTAKIAMLFEPVKNTIGQTTATAMQILGLVLMVLVFSFGYYCGKKGETLVE